MKTAVMGWRFFVVGLMAIAIAFVGEAMAVTSTFSLTMRGLEYDNGSAIVPPSPQVGGFARTSAVAYSKEILCNADFSPIYGGTISSSLTALRFHVVSKSGTMSTGQTVAFYKQDKGAWNASAMYDTYDANTPWSIQLATAVTVLNPGWYTFALDNGGSNLVAALQSIANAYSSNNGFVLGGNFGFQDWYVNIDSVELTVDYVPAPSAPTITTQPVAISRNLGQSASFTIVATGNPAPTYQWRKNGTDIPGATASTYSIPTVTYSNAGNYDCYVTNVNGSISSSYVPLNVGSAPSIVTFSPMTVPEAGQYRKFIGKFTTIDTVDTFDTKFQYSLNQVGDYMDFWVSHDSLFANGYLDYEYKPTYSFTIKSTDSGMNFIDKPFTLVVTNVNEQPGYINLSSMYIDENRDSGSAVGKLNSVDPDSLDVVTFSFSADSTNDNSYFVIAGDSLRTKAVFNYELKSSYCVRVKATDALGLTKVNTVWVYVQNLNEVSTDVVIHPAVVSSVAGPGTFVGNVNATDPDNNYYTLNYSLVAGAGGSDNSLFTLSGNQLYTVSGGLPVGVKLIRIMVESGGLTYEKPLTVTVYAGPQVPSLSMPMDSGILSLYGPVVSWQLGTTSAPLVVGGDSLEYTVQISSVQDFATIVDSDTLRDATSWKADSLKFAVDGIYYWRIRATDANGTSPWSPIRWFKIRPVKIWDNDNGNGYWSTAANWKPDGVPGATDDVLFGPLSPASCTLTTPVAIANIKTEPAWTGSFQLNGKKLTVTGDFDASAHYYMFNTIATDTIIFSPGSGKNSTFKINTMGYENFPSLVMSGAGGLKIKGHGLRTQSIKVMSGSFAFDTAYPSYDNVVTSIVVSGSAGFDFGGARLHVKGTGTVDFSAAGSIVKSYNATLTFDSTGSSTFTPMPGVEFPPLTITRSATNLVTIPSGSLLLSNLSLQSGASLKFNGTLLSSKHCYLADTTHLILGAGALFKITSPSYLSLNNSASRITGSTATVEIAAIDSAVTFYPWLSDTAMPSLRITGTKQVSINDTLTCKDLTASGGTVTFANYAKATVQRSLLIDGGIVNSPELPLSVRFFKMTSGTYNGSSMGDLTVDSAFSVTGGTYNHNGSKLFLTGASDTGIFDPGTPLYGEINITRPSGGWKLTSALKAFYLKVNSGTVNLGSGLAHMVDSVRAIGNATNLAFGSSSLTTKGTVDFTGMNNCIPGTGSLIFAGTGTQNFSPAQPLKMPALIHSGSGTVVDPIHTQAISFSQSAGSWDFAAKSITCDSGFTVTGGQLSLAGATINAWRFSLAGVSANKLMLTPSSTCTFNIYGPQPASADFAVLRNMSIIGPKYGVANATCIDSGSNSNWGFTKTWSGASSANWFYGTNWVGNTVPGILDSVVIGTSPNVIALDQNVRVRALTVTPSYGRPFDFGSKTLTCTGPIDLRGITTVTSASGSMLILKPAAQAGVRRIYTKPVLRLPFLADSGQGGFADTVLVSGGINLPAGMSLNYGVFHWGDDSTVVDSVSRISGTMPSGLMIFGKTKVLITGDSSSFGFQVNNLPKAELRFTSPYMQTMSGPYTDTLPFVNHVGTGTLNITNRFTALGFNQDSGTVNLSGIDSMRLYGPLTIKTTGGSITGLTKKKTIRAARIAFAGTTATPLDLTPDSLLTISATDTVTASYVRIKNCAATSASGGVYAKSSVDLGGNTGWNFSPTARLIVKSPLTGFTPDTMSFADSSTGTITKRIWIWGDATKNDTVTTGGIRTHIYTVPGSYTVKLKTIGTLLADSASSAQITVAGSAKAGFGAALRTGTDTLRVTFADSSTGTITAWYWNYGDGSKIDTFTKKTNPVHLYNKAGSYTLRLIVVGGAKPDTLTRAAYITVLDGSAPTAPASLSITPLSSTSAIAHWAPSASPDVKEIVLRFGLDSARITDTAKSVKTILRPNSAGVDTLVNLPAWGIKLYGHATARDSAGLVSLPVLASTILPDGVAPVNAVSISMTTLGDTAVLLAVKAVVSTLPAERADSIRIAYAYATAAEFFYTSYPYKDTIITIPNTVSRGWYKTKWITADIAGNLSSLRTDSVNIVNASPRFTIKTTSLSVKEDSLFNLIDIVRDVNIDPVTVTLLAAPDSVTLYDSSAATAKWSLAWLPRNGDVGTHQIVCRADDGQGGTDTLTLTITVVNVNDAPDIVEVMLPDSIYEDSLLAGTIIAKDVDKGDSLKVSFAESTWVSVGTKFSTIVFGNDSAAQWTLAGRPQRADTGLCEIFFVVKDASGAVSQQTRTIYVRKTHHAPVPKIDAKYVAGGAARVKVSGIGDGDTALTYTVVVSGGDLSRAIEKTGSKGMFDFYPLTDGRYGISVSALDNQMVPSTTPLVDSFTVAGASRGTLPAGGWTMFSVPATAVPSLPVASRGGVARWDETQTVDGIYQYYRRAATIPLLEAGASYWTRLDTAVSFNLTKEDFKTEDDTIPLAFGEFGWNQIASPYPYPVNLTSGDSLWEWDPVSHDVVEAGTVMQPWKGYWLKTDSTRSLYVNADPWFGKAAVARTARAHCAGRDDWTLSLSLVSNVNRDDANVMGVSRLARNGVDIQDRDEPPRPGDEPSLSFVQSASPNRPFARVMSQPISGVGDWKIRVLPGNSSVKNISLSINGLSPDFPYYLFVATPDSIFEYTDGASIEIDPKTAVTEKTLFVTADRNFAINFPRAFAAAAPYPNPCRGFARVNYVLPWQWSGAQSGYPVKLVMYDLKGRLVRTLVDEVQSYGRYSAAWDGLTQNGSAAASGFYILHLTAGPYVSVQRLVLSR